MILWLMSYLTLGLVGVFMLLSVACGLLYLTEIIEEYSVQAKRIIERLIMFILVLHVLCIGSLPFWNLLFSFCAHLFYTLMLQDFPCIQMSSPVFLVSCVLVLIDHFMWFQLFSAANNAGQGIVYKFGEISAVFALLVWITPFTLFISLSASDNTLPAFDASSSVAHDGKRQKLGNSLRSMLQNLFETLRSWLPAKAGGGLASPKNF